MLTLLATFLRLSAAATMPGAVQQPPATAAVADAYDRFVAVFGPDASICAAMQRSADRYRPLSKGRDSGQETPSCAVCPLCTSIRDGPTMVLPPPAPVLPIPTFFLVLVQPLPPGEVQPPAPLTLALARAPPIV